MLGRPDQEGLHQLMSDLKKIRSQSCGKAHEDPNESFDAFNCPMQSGNACCSHAHESLDGAGSLLVRGFAVAQQLGLIEDTEADLYLKDLEAIRRAFVDLDISAANFHGVYEGGVTTHVNLVRSFSDFIKLLAGHHVALFRKRELELGRRRVVIRDKLLELLDSNF